MIKDYLFISVQPTVTSSSEETASWLSVGPVKFSGAVPTRVCSTHKITWAGPAKPAAGRAQNSTNLKASNFLGSSFCISINDALNIQKTLGRKHISPKVSAEVLMHTRKECMHATANRSGHRVWGQWTVTHRVPPGRGAMSGPVRLPRGEILPPLNQSWQKTS